MSVLKVYDSRRKSNNPFLFQFEYFNLLLLILIYLIYLIYFNLLLLIYYFNLIISKEPQFSWDLVPTVSNILTILYKLKKKSFLS